jgi:hypothetical protein
MLYNIILMLSNNYIFTDKPVTSYSANIIKEINLISYDKNESHPIGTFSYRSTLYPSDIDAFELIQECCDMNTVIILFLRKIQDIVKEILTKRNHWFLELKAGLDNRYNLDIGQLHNMQWLINPELHNNIFTLYHNNLLSRKEYEILNSLITNNPGPKEYEILKKMLREHYILRWSAIEVLRGYKQLSGGIIKTLQNAFIDKSQINMELIVIINNKIVDISNFFAVEAIDNLGNVTVINLPQESHTDFENYFKENLKSSIEKLYYSILEPNYLKLAKRYFSYGRFTKNSVLINKVLPLLNSSIGLAGQLKSEIAVIIKLIEFTHGQHLPLNIIVNQLDNLKTRLSHVIEINNDTLTMLNELIQKAMDQINPINMIEFLSPIKKMLEELTNQYSLIYLKRVKLAPPPRDLLPSK